MQGPNFLPLKLFFVTVVLFGYSSGLRLGETCSTTDNNCDAGLCCGTCPANGNTRPRCTRTQPIIPTTRVRGLPFNRYSWLTTHNSFARTWSTSGTGSSLLAPTNQEDSITDQLRANGTFGTCDVPALSPPPPAQLSPPTGRAQGPTSHSPSIRRPFLLPSSAISSMILLLWLLSPSESRGSIV